MFSPSFAISCVTASADGLGRLGGSGQLRQSRRIARSRLAERVVRRDPVGQPSAKAAEVGSVRATKSVSQLTSTSTAALGRDAGDDEPLGGRPVRPCAPRPPAPLAEDLLGLLEVAVGFHERLLAVHHPDAGLGAQIGHRFGRDFHGSPDASESTVDSRRARSARAGRLSTCGLRTSDSVYEATSDDDGGRGELRRARPRFLGRGFARPRAPRGRAGPRAPRRRPATRRAGSRGSRRRCPGSRGR